MRLVLVHSWWEFQHMQPLLKSVQRLLRKAKRRQTLGHKNNSVVWGNNLFNKILPVQAYRPKWDPRNASHSGMCF